MPLAPAADAGPRPDAPPGDAAIPGDSALSDDAPVADVGTAADAGAPDAAACVHVGGPPSAEFLALHVSLIRPGCVGAGRFCHEGAYEGFAMLTPELALANLIDVTGCAETRVVPCRPEESYASYVMRTGGEPCGRPFPSISGASHPTFSDTEIAAFESWIRSGAN